MKRKAVVIGSGFAGISAASHLAKEGYEVFVVEKNPSPGGRARVFEAHGFKFDMGPSWYWMPDIFEKYFNHFDKKPSDYYSLVRLDPSYKVIFEGGEMVDVPADFEALKTLFEKLEQGSGDRLEKFLDEAAYKYDIGINKLVYKPGRSLLEFADWHVLSGLLRMDILKSFHSHARKYFKDERLLQIIEFPVLFLGAIPQNTPALYSLMNYADMKLGTWYPQKGMFEVVDAMVQLAESLGVRFLFNTEVTKVVSAHGKANSIETTTGPIGFDVLVASADYNHVDQALLDKGDRNYSGKYWDKRVLAPSALIFYLGIDKKLPNLVHHNLFFDKDFSKHANEIYIDKVWPSDPLMYVSCPSKTDPTVAPEGSENIFVLIPVAPGIKDDESVRDIYFNEIMRRLQKHTGVDVFRHLVYKRSYAHNDFIRDYHAFKGNAYGLANTLMQTAILKPKLKSKRLKNMYFTGQLTVPGPGVPPSLISGSVVAREIVKDFS